jgi:hypothetical protein
MNKNLGIDPLYLLIDQFDNIWAVTKDTDIKIAGFTNSGVTFYPLTSFTPSAGTILSVAILSQGIKPQNRNPYQNGLFAAVSGFSRAQSPRVYYNFVSGSCSPTQNPTLNPTRNPTTKSPT